MFNHVVQTWQHVVDTEVADCWCDESVHVVTVLGVVVEVENWTVLVEHQH